MFNSAHDPRGTVDDPGAVVIATLGRLIEIAPAGFAIGLHIRYMTPAYMFESYPADWLDVYARDGLLMRDPTVRWAMHHHGAKRWAELEEQDGAGVLARAREYGIVHGHTPARSTRATTSASAVSRAAIAISRRPRSRRSES